MSIMERKNSGVGKTEWDGAHRIDNDNKRQVDLPNECPQQKNTTRRSHLGGGGLIF